MSVSVGAIGQNIAKKAPKNKLGLLMGVGMTAIFALPEIPKVKAAAKEGKGLEQTLGSIVNVGKWMAVPALAVALLNPVSAAASVLAGLAGFVLPSFIPEIDVAEKKNQGLSYLS